MYASALPAESQLRVNELQGRVGAIAERLDPPEGGRRPVTHDELWSEQLYRPEAYGKVDRLPRLDPRTRPDPGPALHSQNP
ncbi:hypothetical protein Stsp02_67800 [Streptomyces sp. NBRC 14336]|nr:hypothetical protein Stsp02_67800 [Streptomyces sp. NBRC 14336]